MLLNSVLMKLLGSISVVFLLCKVFALENLRCKPTFVAILCELVFSIFWLLYPLEWATSVWLTDDSWLRPTKALSFYPFRMISFTWSICASESIWPPSLFFECSIRAIEDSGNIAEGSWTIDPPGLVCALCRFCRFTEAGIDGLFTF